MKYIAKLIFITLFVFTICAEDYYKTLGVKRNASHAEIKKAFKRVEKDEGVINLWRGCVPTVIRAVVLNFGMLGPFDESKERLNLWLNGDKKKDT